MPEMPSPILLIGDKCLCKTNIVAAKKKYFEYEWSELSAKEYDMDQIRAISGTGDFFSHPKAILIFDIPNRKAFRTFLLDLVDESSDKLKFVLWDSNNEIKVDSKKGTFNKTWGNWIKELKKFPNHTLVNNGGDFSDKENAANVRYIQDTFKRFKRKISADNAKLFISIVGRNRGLVLTEVRKMALTCPTVVSTDYIKENAYPSSKEAVLYKFSNALDEGYEEAISTMEQFLDAGINENLLAEIIAKKARWRMAAIHLWSTGMPWKDVESKLVEMGKFPSAIWHSKKAINGEKKKASEGLDTTEARQKFMIKKLGIPSYYFKVTDKKRASESLPMPFLATQLVNFIKSKMVFANNKKFDAQHLPAALLTKSINDYLFVVNGLKEIRYAENPRQDLYEMIKIMTNWGV